MNSLYFEGRVTDLYSEDYQYLQDSISSEILKLIKAMISGELTSSVIKGFYLSIDPGDTTKLKISHGGLCDSTGMVISKAGILIESSNELERIDLSDYTIGTLNKVFVKCEQVLASVNRETGEIVENQRKDIDYYNYTLAYNRKIDKMSIVVYTQAEYEALSQAQKDLLVILGQTEAQGDGVPLLSVDTSVVVQFKLNIPEHLIEFKNLAHDFMLPQRMVYHTSTGDINDQYLGTPANLINDLNKIRTQIRNIKATPHWDDYHAGISGNDLDMNELHRSGVFPHAYNTYGYILTSGGYSIVIESGKALINRNIREDTVNSDSIPLVPGDAFSIGNYSTRTNPEQHLIPFQPYPQPYTFYLNYYPATNLYIVDSDGSLLVEGLDYTFVSSTGTVTTIVGGDMVNETVDCYYESGGFRCDLIAIGINGFSYLTGVPVTSPNPMPPLLTSTGLLPLYYLYRYPRKDYIEPYEIVDGRFYVFPVKEIRELGYEDLASYYGSTFEQHNTIATHKMSFFSTSSGIVVDKGLMWNIVQTPAGLGINMKISVYMETFLYTRQNDQFWILAEPTHEGTIHIGPTSEVLTVTLAYELTPGSGILDGNIEKTVLPTVYNTSTGILPVLITSTGFKEGVTRIKLSIKSGTQLTFWKILIGRTDLEYIDNLINFVWNNFNELYINTREYSKHLEYLDLQNESLRDRLSKTEILNIEQELRLDFLLGRTSSNSNVVSDIFTDISETDKTIFEQHNSIVDIMDDTIFSNNWKNTSKISDLDYKNGFVRQRKQPYMMEIIDEYSMDGIGRLNKCSITYDNSNKCYWLISNAGSGDIGEITKLNIYLYKGKIEIMGRWILPSIASAHWSGITVDSTNKKLYIVSCLIGTGVIGSTIYGLSINSDGSLGVVGHQKYSGETIDLSTSIFASYTDATTGAAITDLVVYDSQNIGYLAASASGATWDLKFRKLDLTASTLQTINGFGSGVTGNQTGRSIELYEGNLYIKINDTTTQERGIYKINVASDIVSNSVRRYSGFFQASREITRKNIYANEGISVGPNGDLVEICSTASNGDILFRRAIQGSLWGENQVAGIDQMVAAGSVKPTTPQACMIDGNGWLYTGHSGVTAGTVYIYRYKPLEVSNSSMRSLITGSSNCTGLIDAATDGTNVLLILQDATNYSIYKGTLSALTVALDGGSPITVPDATWTLVPSTNTTDIKRGICYNADDNIFYILNNTQHRIDTITASGSGTYTTGVYALPNSSPPLISGGSWCGISYKNKNIYVGNISGAATPCKIYVLPVSMQTSSLWYRSHIHQDPSRSFYAAGIKCMDFKGNNLIIANSTYLSFLTMKVLEDPDVLQLHSFIDSANILLYDNVARCTSIAERYFEPHQFFDRLDCPNKFYMAVGYATDGFSILHLDEFLFDKTPTGKDRYDATKISISNYIKGTSVIGTSNVIFNASAGCNALYIEKDIIFYSSSYGTHAIDLKSGKSWFLDTGTYAGYYYNGPLSQRNDGKGYAGTMYSDLALGSTSIQRFSSRTFSNLDQTDYSYLNPKTYVAMGTGATGVDLLKIDWDSSGNRTLVKVYNNVLATGTTQIYAVCIAQSGKLFAGTYDSSGVMYKQPTGFVWDIITDSWGGIAIGVSNFSAYITDISENSYCWKSTSGIWNHRLFVSLADKSASAVLNGGLRIIDVENVATEQIYHHLTYSAGNQSTFDFCDVFEDVCVVPMYSADATDAGLIMAKKLHFSDSFPVNVSPGSGGFRNNWVSLSAKSTLDNSSSPYFYRYTTSSNLNRSCKISSDMFKILCCATDLGLQLFYFPYFDNCIHRSNIIPINNPEEYVYRQHKLSGYGD